MHGFILVDKPQGLTSQQAIYHLRKKLLLPKTLKIGHAGTLDPLATGMLAMALGSATKFLGYLLNSNKTYVVTAKLGQVTTTLDAEGEILSESIVPDFDEKKILTIFEQFSGLIHQIPPMYSALKFQGRPLYDYARKGQEITRAPRAVYIHHLMLQPIVTKDKFSFVSRVSKGTYIRSLVHDMGQVLGCGAHVEALHREQLDPFETTQMKTIDELSLDQLRPVESIFSHLEKLRLGPIEIKKLKSGQKLSKTQFPALKKVNHLPINSLLRLYNEENNEENNEFMGLLKIDEQGLIKGEKWV